MTTPLMYCGHSANAIKEDGSPVCAICVGLVEGANKVVPGGEQPDLTNRMAKCIYCNSQVQSNLNLPFFKFKPAYSHDWFYCGCRGWD